MGEYETLKERRFSAPLKRPPGLFPLPAVIIIVAIIIFTIMIGVTTIIVMIIVIIIIGPLEKTPWTFSSTCGELIIMFIVTIIITIISVIIIIIRGERYYRSYIVSRILALFGKYRKSVILRQYRDILYDIF